MKTKQSNPFLYLACFGLAVAAEELATGQMPERAWTVKEVAEELGLSPTLQRKWRQAGKLECVTHGRRVYYASVQLKMAGLLREDLALHHPV